MTVTEWSTIANLATALGTLILAIATFSSIRSSNLMARVAQQQQLLVELRPVLTTSRREDPALKVNFGDLKWVRIPGGGAAGETGPGDGSAGPDTLVVYLAIALRNAGNGIAVLHGWRFFPEMHRDEGHAPLEEFQRQNRDLYIPVGDAGFWQGAFRDSEAPGYPEARKVIEAREPWTVELLYADHEGGQRAISRFLVLPVHHHQDETGRAGSLPPAGTGTWTGPTRARTGTARCRLSRSGPLADGHENLHVISGGGQREGLGSLIEGPCGGNEVRGPDRFAAQQDGRFPVVLGQIGGTVLNADLVVLEYRGRRGPGKG